MVYPDSFSFPIFILLSRKNDPHIRIPAAFPGPNRVNYVLKTTSV